VIPAQRGDGKDWKEL